MPTWTIEGESYYDRHRYVLARCPSCSRMAALLMHLRGTAVACDRCGAVAEIPAVVRAPETTVSEPKTK